MPRSLTLTSGPGSPFPAPKGGIRRLRPRTLAIVLLAAFLLLVAPALTGGGRPGRAQSGVAYAERKVSYTVKPGDTLWSIAQRIAPGRDPRPVVDQLVADNHLRGSLQVGQAIDLPVPIRH